MTPVLVPMVVPLTITAAPITALPAASTTSPVISALLAEGCAPSFFTDSTTEVFSTA